MIRDLGAREPWLAAAGIIVVGVIVAAVVGLLVRRLGRRTLGDEDRADRLSTVAVLSVLVIFGVAAVSRLLGPAVAEPGLSAAGRRLFSALPDILIAILLVAVGVVLATAARTLLRRFLEPVRPGVAELAAQLGYWALLGLAVLLAAEQVGVETGFLQRLLLVLLAATAFAVALSFGLGTRDLVSAVVAGRHVGQIVSVGDEVEVEGLRGVVAALGHASVRLRLDDGVDAEVPNPAFLSGVVLVRRPSDRP